MPPVSDLRFRLNTAVRRALILDGKTRISRGLYEASFSTQASDPRRKPKNAQKPYCLVESETSFLNTGEPPGSYRDRPDKLRSRIEAKVNRLPDRMELLFEDVSLLDHPLFSEREATFSVADGEERGYFTPEQWGDAWQDLMKIHPREDLTDAFAYRSTHSHNPAGEFGRKLGELWESLMLYPPDIPPQRLWIDAIQGFIDGLYLDNPDLGGRDRPQERQEFIETLVEEIEDRAVEKIDTEAETEREWFNDWQAKDRSIRQTQEKVTKILDDEGIDPVLVGTYVHFEFSDHLQKHTSTAESAVEEEITPDAVREFVKEERLREKAAILAKIHDDAEAVREKSGRGPEPTDILEAVYRMEGASSMEIAKECTKRTHQAGVTETATDMAGERNPGERPGKIWDEFPILEGDPEEWALTTYGRLLAEHMFSGHLGIGVKDLTDDHVELLAPKIEREK